jgi:hypothetical protein
MVLANEPGPARKFNFVFGHVGQCESRIGQTHQHFLCVTLRLARDGGCKTLKPRLSCLLGSARISSEAVHADWVQKAGRWSCGLNCVARVSTDQNYLDRESSYTEATSYSEYIIPTSFPERALQSFER